MRALSFVMFWAVLATVAVLPFLTSASPGEQGWNPRLGGSLVGLCVGHAHHGNKASRDVGTSGQELVMSWALSFTDGWKILSKDLLKTDNKGLSRK